MYERPAVKADGMVMPSAALPGWHADLGTEDELEIASLAPYAVSPVNPRHTVAGVAC